MDLPNEQQIETKFATRVTEVFTSLREEILTGPTQINYDNFQARLAEVIEDETAAIFVIVLLLLLAWFDDQMSDDTTAELQESLGQAASEFGKMRGRQVARDVRKSIEGTINDIRWDIAIAKRRTDTPDGQGTPQEPLPSAPSTLADQLKQATDDSVQQLQQIPDDSKAIEQIAAKLKAELDKALSAARAATIAVTETTTAYSAGEAAAAAAIEAARDVRLPVVWLTEEDEKVCPLCGPLHNKGPVAWAHLYPSGPPAHPNCRCRKARRIVPLAPRGSGQKKTSKAN